MSADRDRLLDLAQAIADGTPLDWADEESSRAGDERALVRELRVLSGVAEAHRSIGEEPAALPEIEAWGPLVLRECLGSGTFGAVYRAWDARLGRDVALKLLHRGDPDAHSPVIEEARLLARVRHPHVVTVYGADAFDGRVGIWMELIRGRTLDEIVRHEGTFSAREAASIGVELSAALAAVHHARILHRDIKAQNVLREHGGRFVLMDFGAGHEMTGHPSTGLSGTPVYMAPEVLRGDAATVASDVFSLGVLLFHIVTGDYPAGGRTAEQVRAAQDKRTYRLLTDLRPDLPQAFVDIVERALSPRPDHRYESAGAMQAALRRFLEDAIVDRSTSRDEKQRRRVWPTAIGLVTLATAAVVVSRGPWRSAAISPPPKSVAVLPFTAVGDDGRQDYFASGITEILMSRLAAVPRLRVIARTSVTALPPDGRAPAALRSRLHADYAIEGTVERDHERVRVNARVLEAGLGTVLWAQTYERALADSFALQEELATTIAGSVGGAISERVRPRRYTRSVEAQDEYFRGRYLIYTFNSANFVQAREHFERAIATDPDFALAHASLARTLGLLLDFDIGQSAELEPIAIREAAEAVRLDPDLAETNVAQADVQFRYAHHWTAAEAAYRRALAIAPYSSLVLTPYARFLCAAGRLDEGIAEARAGAESDPLSAEMLGTVGIAYYYKRDIAEAQRWFDRVLEVAPNTGPAYFGKARAYAEQGQYDAAISAIRKALSLVGENASYDAELARVLALAGRRELADQTLGGLLVRADTGRHIPYEGIGYAYAALGQRDEAFAWLNRAAEHYFARLLFLNVDPRADSLRKDPRYFALVRRLGLEP